MIVFETFKQRKRVKTQMTILDMNETRHDKLHFMFISYILIFNLQSSLRLLSIVHIVSGGGSGDNTIPIGCQAASEHQLQDFSCQRNTLRSPAVFWRVNGHAHVMEK